MVNFSSYGPDQVHTGLQKPDLAAEGTDVIAAVAPPGNDGRDFDAYSGTSMAAPHVAGMAAILKGLHSGLVARHDRLGTADHRDRYGGHQQPAETG